MLLHPCICLPAAKSNSPPAGKDRFHLRTRHGGVALWIDPRILDLRAFRIRWGDPAPESAWQLDVLTREPARGWTGGNWQSAYAARMPDPRYLHTNACGGSHLDSHAPLVVTQDNWGLRDAML